jgi:hypothetical protein
MQFKCNKNKKRARKEGQSRKGIIEWGRKR